MTATTGESNLADFRAGLSGGPVRWVLDFFSSVWLGIWLIAILFVYSSIGSVGMWIPVKIDPLIAQYDWIHEIYWFIPWTQMHIRQAPGLEMTEFGWFHWWPFNVVIALICINLVVATVRRIPFNVINLGVWMIHSGIIILAVGSVMYFATKLEGDAPIIRRQIEINVPGTEPVSLPVNPGSRKELETNHGEYIFQVMNIDPEWELLTGEDRGKRVFAIFVGIQSPQHQFVRQLIAGYPEYTEDTIWTGRQDQPMVRAINELGRPLVDDEIDLSLDYHPQEHFYLMDSAALYLREKGDREWVQRPIHNLPRYNDYLVSEEDVWRHRNTPPPRISPLEIPVEPHEADDPLDEAPLYVTRFIRYGALETQRHGGGTELDPAIAVRLRGAQGQTEEYQLVAFDPESNLVEGGRLQFVWVDSREEFQELTDVQTGRLTIRVPEHDVEIEVDAIAAQDEAQPYQQIEGTPFSYRIEAIERLDEAMIQGVQGIVQLVIVQFQTPERTFRRWVFDRETIPSRDLPVNGQSAMHTGELELDERIETAYTPAPPRPLVTLVAGPDEENLHMVLALPGHEPSVQPLRPNAPMTIQRGLTLEVLSYAARTTAVRKPVIIPPQQRERSDRMQRSIISVHLPIEGGKNVWLPYHLYPFRDRNEVMRRFPYRPTEVELDDGRVIEVLFSRERRQLPTRIALHDFVLTAHIGGFTGQTTSIRDWTSVIRYETEDGWSDIDTVSMNRPASYGGFWYFQSQWDPPDPPRFEGDVESRGLNFTVLGVGNRNGVWTQLFGSCVAVIGMMYSFWVKPILKRRRQERVYEQVRSEGEDLEKEVV